MAAYARNELGFKTEMTYALLAPQVTGGWDWHGGRLQASAEDDLRTLLAFSPSFRLLIAHGLFRHDHALRHDALRARPSAATDTAGRAQLKLYRGGHMLYIDPQSRKAFSADAAAFYRRRGSSPVIPGRRQARPDSALQCGSIRVRSLRSRPGITQWPLNSSTSKPTWRSTT